MSSRQCDDEHWPDKNMTCLKLSSKEAGNRMRLAPLRAVMSEVNDTCRYVSNHGCRADAVAEGVGPPVPLVGSGLTGEDSFVAAFNIIMRHG